VRRKFVGFCSSKGPQMHGGMSISENGSRAYANATDKFSIKWKLAVEDKETLSFRQNMAKPFN